MDLFIIYLLSLETLVISYRLRSMEEEKFDREERFVAMKDTILKRYMELEEEPETEFERYYHIIETFFYN